MLFLKLPLAHSPLSWAEVFINTLHISGPGFLNTLTDLYSLELLNMNTMWSHCLPSPCHSWVECALKESHSSFESGFQSRIVVKDFLFLFLQFFLNLRGHSCFGRWCFMYREIFGLLGIGPEAPGPASHLCPRIFPCPGSWFLVRPWSSLPIGKKSLDWRPIISSPTSSSDVSLSWKLRTCCPGVLFVHSLLGDLGIVAKCSSLVDNCCIYVFS